MKKTLLTALTLLALSLPATMHAMTFPSPDAEVFSGNSPSSFTDLDLSSVVGANPAFVYLLIQNRSGSLRTYRFMRKGDSGDTFNQAGVSWAANLDTGFDRYAAVITDADGVVQWNANGTTGTTTIKVIAYDDGSGGGGGSIEFPEVIQVDNVGFNLWGGIMLLFLVVAWFTFFFKRSKIE